MEELLEKVEEITEETAEKPVEQPQPEQPLMELPAPTTAQLEKELEELRKDPKSIHIPTMLCVKVLATNLQRLP